MERKILTEVYVAESYGKCLRCRATGKVTRSDGVVVPCLECDGRGLSGNPMNEGYAFLPERDKQMLGQSKEVALKPQTQVSAQPTQQIYIPSETDWNFMTKWGNSAVRTGMLPSSIKSGEAAALIILKGRELGLSFMTAVAQIHIINGRPTLSAELIQGLARKNLPGLVINILESDDKIAKIEFIRPEKGAKPFVQSFTWESAVAAKLTNKDVWKQYPAAMLWSRCVTAGLRKVCPEALMGISYTPEEMGAEVDEGGNVIETTGRHVNEPAQKNIEKEIDPAKEAAVAAVERNAELEQKKKLGQQIKVLKAELELTDEEIKAEAHRLFKKEDFKLMTVEDLTQLVKVLEEEKIAREKPSEPVSDEFEQAVLNTPDPMRA